MRKLILSVAVMAAVAGCASTDTKDQAGAPVVEGGTKPPVVTTTPAPPPKQVTKPADTGVVTSAPPVGTPLEPSSDPSNILSKRSVYFDYDSSAVKDEYKSLVTAHARFLQQNRPARIAVQGNTDERGSREYNLALGQRRADSVKQMMILLGAQDAQIESVSFGEEKPRSTGAGDAAFSENRRADIVYQGR